MLSTRAADNRAYLAYCNLVGGQDELVFDGQGMVFDPDGHVIARAAPFDEDFLVADLDLKEVLRRRLFDPRRRKQAEEKGLPCPETVLPPLPSPRRVKPVTPKITPPLSPEGEVYQALVLGTRDYCRKNGFKEAVVGLSGGIDSSLTAALAAEALGGRIPFRGL